MPFMFQAKHVVCKQKRPQTVTDKKLMLILKICITLGILLILLGVYFHNFSETIDEMGVNGIIISAVCIAIGMILSLPTKMYLTFILVKRESEKKHKH
ncbi:MAG: nitrate reductase gamma subunit [Paraglaciecola sp.]|jgi:nitrate reductase gamma subunit